jgi:hypothetical protein
MPRSSGASTPPAPPPCRPAVCRACPPPPRSREAASGASGPTAFGFACVFAGRQAARSPGLRDPPSPQSHRHVHGDRPPRPTSPPHCPCGTGCHVERHPRPLEPHAPCLDHRLEVLAVPGVPPVVLPLVPAGLLSESSAAILAKYPSRRPAEALPRHGCSVSAGAAHSPRRGSCGSSGRELARLASAASTATAASAASAARTGYFSGLGRRNPASVPSILNLWVPPLVAQPFQGVRTGRKACATHKNKMDGTLGRLAARLAASPSRDVPPYAPH